MLKRVVDIQIQNFGQPLLLIQFPGSFVVEYSITALVAMGSQHFYASRLYMVEKRPIYKVIPATIVFLSIGSFIAAIATTVELFKVERLIAHLSDDRFSVLISIYSGLAAACDIIATISMCIFLMSQNATYSKTKSVLKSLLFYTINRGVLVAIAQVGLLVTFIVAPQQGYWMPFHLSISKLHINTLLAMLNARDTLRFKSFTGTNSWMTASHPRSASPGHLPSHGGTGSAPSTFELKHFSTSLAQVVYEKNSPRNDDGKPTAMLVNYAPSSETSV